MTAGLPKAVGILCLAIVMFAVGVAAQDLPSLPPAIEPVLDI